MFRSKKKKKDVALSCPFCGEVVEDVSQHVLDCSGVHGAVRDLSHASETHTAPSPSAPNLSTEPAAPPPVVPPPRSPRNNLPTAASQPVFAMPAVKQLPTPPITPSEPEQSATVPPTRAQPPVPVPRVAEKANTMASIPVESVHTPEVTSEPVTEWKSTFTKPKTGERRGLLASREAEPPKEVETVPPKVEDVVEPEIEEEEEEEISFPVGIALYDYEQSSEVEISIKEGQSVYVLDQSDPDWIYIGFDGLEGFVPVDYIEVQPPETENDNSSDTVSAATQPETVNEPVQSNVETTPAIDATPAAKEEPKVAPRPAARKPTITAPPRDVLAPSNTSGRPTKSSKKPSYIGSISSTLRSRKKKKPMEFSIARADTPPVSGPPVSPRSLSVCSPSDAPSGIIEKSPRAAPIASTQPVSADQRTNIAREILQTESNYMNIISSMISRYRETLLYRIDAFGSSITKDMIMDIFSNLEMIIPINQQLCSDLQKVVDDWNDTSTVGDIFVRVAPFMKMYNQYSNRYDQSLATLGKCMKNEEFSTLVEEIDGTAKLGSRLESLLIAPIQRIPRYSLLLSELKKATPDNHPDIAHLEKAIPLVQQVANYINKNMAEVENQEKLLSLSLAGAQSLLKPHRVLLHEGIVIEGKKKEKIHIWLFNDILVQIPDSLSKKKENLNKPKYQWPLHLIWLGDTAVKNKTQSTWGVTGPTKSYVFTCLIEEATAWVSKIAGAIKQHLEYLSVTQDTALTKEKEANMTFENPNRFGTFTYPNTATYTGWWKDGEFEGNGTFCFFGSIYVGTFIKSLKEGKGVLNYFTGEVYDGEWKADKQNGQGTLTYPNGDIYTGGWLDGLKHGKGSLTCSLGDSYVGEWAKDQPQGLGDMTYKSGMVYNGNWENGLRHHYGILVNPTGEKYEGEWQNGVRHGKGRMEYFEGCYYDGNWKEGYYYGKGKYVSPAGTYEGEFVYDMKEGTGTMTYANGKVYKGQWKKNLYHGTGTLTVPSGLIECYTGEWNMQKKQGSGILRFFNGDLYEGHFKDNKFHGSGTYSFGNGITLKCKFTRGAISGECVFTRPPKPNEKKNANIYTGVYKDGMLVAADRPPIYIPTIPTGEIDLM